MCVHVRKMHVPIRSVDESRVDVFVVPGQFHLRSRCRLVHVFQSSTRVDVVVGVADHFGRDY